MPSSKISHQDQLKYEHLKSMVFLEHVTLWEGQKHGVFGVFSGHFQLGKLLAGSLPRGASTSRVSPGVGAPAASSARCGRGGGAEWSEVEQMVL